MVDISGASKRDLRILVQFRTWAYFSDIETSRRGPLLKITKR